jgi:uncharacterized protein with PIN domain
MVIDSSALVAILLREPDADASAVQYWLRKYG